MASAAESGAIKVVDVARPDEFDAALEANRGASRLLVLFTGEANEETGKSWCSDCEAADPIIEEALHGAEGVLLRCSVRRSEYKNNAAYFYRQHKKVKLQAIPTLMRWGRTGPVASLVEEQLLGRDSVKDLIHS